ncbi:hypothetical protein ACWEFL_02660 [Streptomyces sp. NPDC004838]
MTQPQDAAPTAAYSDGKGYLRVYCLHCPRPTDVDTPLTIDQIDPMECCTQCGRHLVDVARDTAPTATGTRPTASTITAEQLDQLDQLITTLEHTAARNKQHTAHAVAELEKTTARAEQAEAALDRVRNLHQPVDHRGARICTECSSYDPTSQTTDSTPVAYDQCATLAALNQPKDTP